MSSRCGYLSGRGRGGRSATPSNESSRSRPSLSSTPGHAPQDSSSSLPPPPPPPSISRDEVPTNVPTLSTLASYSSTAPNGRLQIHVEGGSIVSSHKAAAVLREIFQSLIDYDGTNWKRVTAETKRIYREEFYKRCTWDSIYEDEIARAYPEKVATCYKHTINSWKDGWFKNRKKPACLPEDTWQNFLEYWDRPEVKKKSEQNKRNRLSEPCGEGTGISIHRGGSKSAQDHALEITKQKGETASEYDVFLRMHPVENNVPICGKAKKIYDEVQEKSIALTQSLEGSTESQQVDMNKLFVETARVQKGSIFGIGNISKTHTSSSYRSSASSSVHETEITRRLNEMHSEIRDELRAEIRAEMRAEMQQMMANMMQGRVNSPRISEAPAEGVDQNDLDVDHDDY